jgi:chloramphenicol-sensitive protein RarD
MMISKHNEFNTGITLSLLAYGSWGLFPLYWSHLKGIAPLEILGHRMLWSGLFLTLFLLIKEKKRFFSRIAPAKGAWNYLLLSALFITVNWCTFVYAVVTDQVLESSLGYFIAPLITVSLGTFILKEELKPLQKVSLAFAISGVLLLTLHLGKVPYLALLLAVSFGGYGLVRKKIMVDPLIASTLESWIQILPAIGVLFFFNQSGDHEILLSKTLSQKILLVLGGVISVTPLLWFSAAVKRLPLAMMGFLQYITPTLHFMIAVGLYSEPFSTIHAQAFACIWIGVGIYSYELWRVKRQQFAT